MSDASILNNQVHWVEVAAIAPNPFQPRIEFNDSTINELADSIKQYGVLQPLTVTQKEVPDADGGDTFKYELIAGERRLRAAKIAELKKVPVIIRVGDTDKERLELAIIENLQREDLNGVDRAKSFLRLAEDFGLSHTEIGKKMGKSREYVSNTLRILALPDYVLEGLVAKKITEGHTRPLLMLSAKPDKQKILYNDIINYKMSVRAAEARARKEAADRVRKDHLKVDPKLITLEENLSNSLNARVAIETAQDGSESGRLVINYLNTEELNNLIKLMKEVTGNNTLDTLGEDAEVKTNSLPEEKKVETKSGIVLNTGFLDSDLSGEEFDDTPPEESHIIPKPKKFGFNSPHEIETAQEIKPDTTVNDLKSIAHNPQEIEKAVEEKTNPEAVHENGDDGYVSLSELLARVSKVQGVLDSDDIETYERDHDATSHASEDDYDTSIISEEEISKNLTPDSIAANKNTTPDIYSALFNI